MSSTGLTYVANATHSTVDRIAPALPALSAAPTPTGTTTQGQTLTATAGTWANAPTSFAYGWERCNAAGGACASIAGANASSYTLTGDDAGATLRSLVTATNITGATTVASNPTAVIIPQPPAATGAPGIAGTATNLQTLAAAPGSWTNNPTKFAYAWQDCDASGANCTAISGATASTYTLALSDVGDTIRVAVTATNAGGSATATSAPTPVIAPVLTPWANTPVPGLLAAPAVSGSAAVGSHAHVRDGPLVGQPHQLRVPVEPRQRPHPQRHRRHLHRHRGRPGPGAELHRDRHQLRRRHPGRLGAHHDPGAAQGCNAEQAPPRAAPARADPSPRSAAMRRPRRAAGRHTAGDAPASPSDANSPAATRTGR